MSKKVIIYSTPACPYCVMVKDYLKEKGIKFSEVNVASDQAAAKRIVEKTGQMGVPVIEIGDKFVAGFDRAALDQLLG